MKESKIKFIYQLGDGLGGYPQDLEASVEFAGESSLDQVLEGFKMFLAGVGYSPTLVESIYYENTNKNIK